MATISAVGRVVKRLTNKRLLDYMCPEPKAKGGTDFAKQTRAPMTQTDSDILAAPHVLEYPYTRSTGPVIGRFLTGLRERRMEGVRASDGRVIVPPAEYDPVTSEPLEEFVEVGQAGVVTTWAWVYHPRPKHPLDRPFAWALIRLDGADTGMLHAVDAGDPVRMKTGMRVRARWRDEAQGEIQDIACFEPEEGLAQAQRIAACVSTEPEPVRKIRTPIRLDYIITAGEAQSRFLRGVASGKILGQRCPQCEKVYVPPRGACPTCGVPTAEDVELGHKGTVTTFCVVNIPFAGSVEIPYVCASVLLDGADVTLFHLVQEVPVDEVRMGMRVEAVWVPRDELAPTLESIMHFRPTGEPDAPYESYKDKM